MRLSHFLLLFTTIFISSCITTSQPTGVGKTTVVAPQLSNDHRADSLTVIPGPEYQAGWLHRFLLGDHYRDIWTTPVTVPVLNLATFAGGLTPVKQGGGYQTKSLRLAGANGKLYAFRSVNKDPKKVLPQELQETIAADILQDQISSSNPAAPLVVDVLADALGVLHPKPQLVMLPDDDRLGQYREAFAGVLGILEDYPSEGEKGAPGFGNSRKIVGTLKLFEILEKDNRNFVDKEALLTARLLDVFIGDWDRHIDQWRWARYENEHGFRWVPIPRDRDQAFARFDGFFPKIGAMAITQFENFDSTFNDMVSLTYSGRFLDRRLLVSFDKRQWDSVAASVALKLTDSVIEKAVAALPPVYDSLRGHWLAQALKHRRDTFAQAIDEYYEIISDYVDVHFSDDPESVEITRLDDERVQVIAMAGGGGGKRMIFQRTFVCSETEEVRIYLHGGDDKCNITGNVKSSIPVRVVGGGGNDELIDKSLIAGYLWGFVPFIPQAERATFFYDDKGKNKLAGGSSCSVDTRDYDPPAPGLIQY